MASATLDTQQSAGYNRRNALRHASLARFALIMDKTRIALGRDWRHSTEFTNQTQFLPHTGLYDKEVDNAQVP